MAFRWIKPPTTAFKAVIYTRALANALERLLGQAWAPQIEGAAKHRAPWQDQTGNARQTLKAFFAAGIFGGQVFALVLRQTMHYGVYLELAHGGKYAIVMPTLQAHYYQVWADVRRLVEG